MNTFLVLSVTLNIYLIWCLYYIAYKKRKAKKEEKELLLSSLRYIEAAEKDNERIKPLLCLYHKLDKVDQYCVHRAITMV